MFDTIILRTNELCLKGGNRLFFEKRLMENVKSRLTGFADLRCARGQGTVVIRSGQPIDRQRAKEIAEKLERVFGLANFSFAARCARDLGAVSRLAAQVLDSCSGSSFKVESRREDKTFPQTSLEVSIEVGGQVQEASPRWHVDVHDPDVTINVSIHKDGALVMADRLPGPGGLPTGVSGKTAVLLSGGIDSPVAAWKTMRRGCQAVFVHCHSYPYVSDASIDKVKRLAGILAGYQGPSTLYLASIADAQRDIAAKCDESLRIVLYRRLMMRVATGLAVRDGALAVVTGDSIGQVASQTLENLRTVSCVCPLPIFRPLIGDDKDDIVGWARKIGTFATSIEGQDDCCSLFLPKNPATRSTVEQAEREERKFESARFAEEAVLKAERIVIPPKE